jgi:glycosyltransferase involved in cell wall biosynthesis
MIERVGVVIPARNEEGLLPICLDALQSAVLRLEVPVHVVVVLDRCDDHSLSIVEATPCAHAVEVDAGNVGIARAAGTTSVLRWADGVAAENVWLSTTDADSLVPSDWLVRQCGLADLGWDAVLGTVEVADWSEHDDDVAPLWAATYQPVEDHHHVHGANFGCSAAAYLDAGGWAPLAINEDVAMVAALAHRRVVRSALFPVVTSARRDPRAAGGFGDTLRALAG